MSHLDNRRFDKWVGAGLVVLANLSFAADWTQYQGNARHTGFVDEDFEINGPAVRWTFVAPAYSAGPGDRSVAIDSTCVYATVLEGYGPVGPYHVIAFDRQTGAEVWRNSMPANSHSGISAPTLGDSMVYVHGYGHSSSSGNTGIDDYPRMMGLDRSTGVRQFTTTHSGQWSSGSRPTVEGDRIFAAGGYYGGLDAYGTAGGLQWSVKMPQEYGWVPAADGSRVYVYIGQLYAARRDTGATDFQIAVPNGADYLSSSVALGDQNDAFVASSGDGLIAFDLTSRTIKWRVTGAFSGELAVGNGMVAATKGTRLSIYDQATGSELWNWDSGTVNLYNSLVMTDRYAFVAGGSATFAIDLLSHDDVWSVGIGGQLALMDDTLVIANARSLTAFTLPEPTGTLCLAVAISAAAIRRRHRGPTHASM